MGSGGEGPGGWREGRWGGGAWGSLTSKRAAEGPERHALRQGLGVARSEARRERERERTVNRRRLEVTFKKIGVGSG